MTSSTVKNLDVTGMVEDLLCSGLPVAATMAEHLKELVVFVSRSPQESYKRLFTEIVVSITSVCSGKRTMGRNIRASSTPLMMAARTKGLNFVLIVD